MIWKKLGLVFRAEGQFGWMNSHAQIPTALPLMDQGILRLYFSSRPKPGLSLTGMLDVEANDPTRIVRIYEKPVLELGMPGAFDQHGIMPQSCVRFEDGRIGLYYLGWSRQVDIPYSNWTGLALSEDNGLTFRKAHAGPVLDRTSDEIYSATGLFVVRNGDVFRGWYAMGLGWRTIENRLEERYLITDTRSNDGIHWTRSGKPVLATKNENEAMTRPSVIHHGSQWGMWYCKRSLTDFRDGKGSYRIGFARSDDGDSWIRCDEEAGIEPSGSGWDSTMMAYPCVVSCGDKLLMFYCGNGFGAGGFGVAEVPLSAVFQKKE